MSIPVKPIRVLIVADSPIDRDLLVSVLQMEPGFQVAGSARNGAEGVRLAIRLQPDIITMDAHMPVMDGYEATRQIMREAPCPIVMISDRLHEDEHQLMFDAIQAGALSILQKPTPQDSPNVRQELVARLRLMSEVRVVRRWVTTTSNTDPLPPIPLHNGRSPVRIVAMAASTGGPGALAHILGALPVDFPAPILIVQHVTVGFGEGLARWLNGQVALPVRIGRHADEPQPGEVLIAPDDYHMTVNKMGLITLSKTAAVHGLRPTADYLFHSLAEVYGKTAVGVILTGMGHDGAAGLRAMHQAGAYTIAQDEASCVVFGMPAVAVKLAAVTQVQSLDKIANLLMKLCKVMGV